MDEDLALADLNYFDYNIGLSERQGPAPLPASVIGLSRRRAALEHSLMHPNELSTLPSGRTSRPSSAMSTTMVVAAAAATAPPDTASRLLQLRRLNGSAHLTAAPSRLTLTPRPESPQLTARALESRSHWTGASRPSTAPLTTPRTPRTPPPPATPAITQLAATTAPRSCSSQCQVFLPTPRPPSAPPAPPATPFFNATGRAAVAAARAPAPPLLISGEHSETESRFLRTQKAQLTASYGPRSARGVRPASTAPEEQISREEMPESKIRKLDERCVIQPAPKVTRETARQTQPQRSQKSVFDEIAAFEMRLAQNSEMQKSWSAYL